TTPGVVLPMGARRANGASIPVEGTFAAYRDGARVLVTGVVRDISERMRAEEALRRSEASFRALIEGSPDAVFVHRDGGVVYVNPAAVTLVGCADPGALVGKRVIDLFPEAAGAKPGDEQPLMAADGRAIPVDVSPVSVVFQGSPATLASARDLTE